PILRWSRRTPFRDAQPGPPGSRETDHSATRHGASGGFPRVLQLSPASCLSSAVIRTVRIRELRLLDTISEWRKGTAPAHSTLCRYRGPPTGRSAWSALRRTCLRG